MRKVRFAKYNRTRLPEFQTCTTIYEENNVTYVEKKPLNDRACEHLQKMEKNAAILESQYPNLTFPKPQKRENAWVFPFFEGKTASACLLEHLKNPDDFLREIEQLILEVYQTSCKEEFVVTPAFTEYFGELRVPKGRGIHPGNLDMIFDNLMKTEDGWICIDYEWVCDFYVPEKYILYRTLHYFYEKYEPQLKKVISEEMLLRHFGIYEEEAACYDKMELRFQQQVHGENYKALYTARYEKKITTLEEYKSNHMLMADHLNYVNGQLAIMEPEYYKWLKVRNILVRTHLLKLKKPLGAIKRKYLERRIIRKDKKERNKNLRRNKKYRMAGFFLRNFGKLTFEWPQNPLVSIIIPVYNQVSYTYVCLLSLKKFASDVPVEILLADDCSTDATRKIEQHVKGIKVIRNPENLGFLKNCNHAAGFARGKYLLFLNNDTRILEGYLKPLIEPMEKNEKVGMTGSKLLYPDGVLQEAGGIVWKNGAAANYGHGDNPDKPQYCYERQTDYISGASIMIRRELFEKIGRFDERFTPAYCEDTDLAFQVREQGYQVLFEPQSRLMHFEGVSNGRDLTKGIKKYQVENNRKFYEKWKDTLQDHFEENTQFTFAKDHPQGRKVILMMEVQMPTFDKDAGSRTIYQYCRMFLKKGYLVKLAIDNDKEEMEPYRSRFLDMGVEVLSGEEFKNHFFEWILENKNVIDYVFISRPNVSRKYIEFLRANTEIKVLYYGHDLHFLRMEREAKLLGKEEQTAAARAMKEEELAIIRSAHMSFYLSPMEIELLKKMDPSLRVKRMLINVFEEFKENPQPDFSKREGILFVGGFRHDPNIDAVLWLGEEIYPQMKKHGTIPCYIAGSSPTEEIKAFDGEGMHILGFVSDEELEKYYETCRMVIVPLRYGAGIKGKVIEALYHGLPVVTTSIGAEGIDGMEEAGFIVDDAGEFAETVVKLYQNPKKLSELSKKATAFVKDHFGMEAGWKMLEEEFREIEYAEKVK